MIETHLPLGPTPLVNVLIQYMLAGVLLLERLSFTSFQLPKRTPLPLHRGGELSRSVVLVSAVGAAAAVTAAGATVHDHTTSGSDPLLRRPDRLLLPAVLLLSSPPCPLGGAVRDTDGGTSARHLGSGPLIEVIIPAYDEEIVIADLLGTVDAAAGRYRVP